MRRRHFLLTAIGASLAPAFRAQTSPRSEEIEREIEQFISRRADLFGQESDGRGSLVLPPEDHRVREAALFLSEVPSEQDPIDIAKFIMRYRPILEWPPDTGSNRKPANPIIIAFFAATKTEPYSGDQTAWCSAFMCWALEHAGYPSPRSAGSKSFRDYDKFPTTTEPISGDIVVFRNLSDSNKGHVAFFDGYASDDKSVIHCVGGNQSDRLSRQKFMVRDNNLEVVCYRRPVQNA